MIYVRGMGVGSWELGAGSWEWGVGSGKLGVGSWEVRSGKLSLYLLGSAFTEIEKIPEFGGSKMEMTVIILWKI